MIHLMANIVVTEFMDEKALARVAQAHHVHFDPELHRNAGAIKQALSQADALIVRNLTKVTRDLVGAAPNLVAVGRLGVGLDNIDLQACSDRKIRVYPATGANADSVAEYVITNAISLLRQFPRSHRLMGQDPWPRAACSDGREAPGRVLGLVGFGDIGYRTAKLALALGFRVVAYDPTPKIKHPDVPLVELRTVLTQSDVISLHVPLTDQTRHLLNREAIRSLKPGCILINTSRGSIIDEAALLEALEAGHLGGAAIDVFAEEPLKATSPLMACENVVLTPHIAGVTHDSNQRVSDMIADLILQHFV